MAEQPHRNLVIESQHRWDKLMKISQISYVHLNLAIPERGWPVHQETAR